MVIDSRKNKLIRWAKENKPIRDIARDLGLDVTYVYRVLKQENIDIPETIKGGRSTVISPVHQKLGKVLKKERICNEEYDEHKKEFAGRIGLSTHRIGWLEKGYYDPTLTDLIKLLPSLGIKFSEIDKILEEVKIESISK